jgi:threonine/homoserine/homoserine lactone efflux protein
MPDLSHWAVFVSATIALLIVPGPSVMYVVARGIDNGSRAVLYSSAGLALGDVLQVLCTAAGLSALLASSVMLFSVVKYAGAAYLVVLGMTTLFGTHARRHQHPFDVERAASVTRSRSLILQGFFALNPKTALFFLALFPQFMSANAGPAWRQILLFGSAFVVLGFVTNSIFGCLGARLLGGLSRRSPRFQAATQYVSGSTLVALGVAAVVV